MKILAYLFLISFSYSPICCLGQVNCDSLFLSGLSHIEDPEIDSTVYYFKKLLKDCPDSRKRNCAIDLLLMWGYYEKTDEEKKLDSIVRVVYKDYYELNSSMTFFHMVDSLFPKYYDRPQIQIQLFYQHIARGDTSIAIDYANKIIEEAINESDCPRWNIYSIALYKSFLLAKKDKNEEAITSLSQIGKEIPFARETSARHYIQADLWYFFAAGYIYAKNAQVDSALKYLDYYLFLPKELYKFEDRVSHEEVQELLTQLTISTVDSTYYSEWYRSLDSHIQYTENKEKVYDNPVIEDICTKCTLDFGSRILTLFDYCYDYLPESDEFTERGKYYSESHCKKLINQSLLVKKAKQNFDSKDD